jgi:hypothetical protein
MVGRTMVSISVRIEHDKYKLTFEHHHRWNPPSRRRDRHGDSDALTVVCRGPHINGPRAHEVDGDVEIRRHIGGRLIHVQDIVLMTRGIVRSRDLHLEMREGLGAHLARLSLSLVGGHAVRQAIFHEKARNRHHARTTTLL